MRKSWFSSLILSGAMLSVQAQTDAATPLGTAFTYQGQLKLTGAGVTGPVDFQFSLWDAVGSGTPPVGGVQIGATQIFDGVGAHPAPITVTGGLFTTQLDFGTAAFLGDNRWLQIAVRNPAGVGSYTTLAPRQPLTGAPYALQSRGIYVNGSNQVAIGAAATNGNRLNVQGTTAEITGTFRSDKGTNQSHVHFGPTGDWYIRSADSTGKVVLQDSGGSVGVGTASPQAKLHSSTSAVSETAILGEGLGANGGGVSGTGSAGGDGVVGRSSSADSTGFGVHGIGSRTGSLGTGARGVFGESDLSTGVEGNSISGRGVYGKSTSWDGVGGLSTSASGVYGKSTSGIGVFGECTTGAAVYGSSTGGYGVSGFSTNNHGVFGSSANFVGVVGTSVAHDGIQGYTHGSNRSGVVGIAASDSVNGTGGYFRSDSSGGQALYADGKAVVKVLQILGADLTESFNVAGDKPEPGDVVVIDEEHPGELKLCASAYDHKVAGVISGAGGIRTAVVMGQPGSIADGKHAVALTGRVYCRCDATQNPIQVGDLLTTSTIPGHAMKAADREKSSGAVIGKAMTGLDKGRGLVLVLVTLQ